MTPPMTRRQFVTQTVLATTGSTLLPHLSLAATASGSNRPIRLGGPAFENTIDPAELARAHRRLGYGAAFCPDIPLTDTDRIKAFVDAFAKEDVVLAEVGRWVNLLDADPQHRKQNLGRVTDGLALAEALGARCCVDIVGSYSRTSWFGPHPENLSRTCFDAAVENARKIIDAIKPKRAKFCYEMMGWTHPNSPDRCLKLLKAVDRPAFGVHLDPCNLVNSPEKFYNTTALLNECFDKLGRWIVSCHAKDLTWDVEMNLHFREVIPGKGTLDYTTYLKRLAQLPQQPPLMLEHLSGATEYAQGAAHITQTGRAAGLTFEPE